jgi:hypothetical protein
MSTSSEAQHEIDAPTTDRRANTGARTPICCIGVRVQICCVTDTRGVPSEEPECARIRIEGRRPVIGEARCDIPPLREAVERFECVIAPVCTKKRPTAGDTRGATRVCRDGARAATRGQIESHLSSGTHKSSALKVSRTRHSLCTPRSGSARRVCDLGEGVPSAVDAPTTGSVVHVPTSGLARTLTSAVLHASVAQSSTHASVRRLRCTDRLCGSAPLTPPPLPPCAAAFTCIADRSVMTFVTISASALKMLIHTIESTSSAMQPVKKSLDEPRRATS